MGDKNESMRATTGSRFIVIARDEPSDGLGELSRECSALGRRTKTDFGVESERRKMLAFRLGASEELGHLADNACGQRDHVARREPVGGSGRIARGIPHRGRRDDVRRGRGDDTSLDDPTPSTLFDRANETMSLEGPEVIIHLLPRESHAVRERGRRAGLGQLRQKASPNGVERHDGDGWVLDDF